MVVVDIDHMKTVCMVTAGSVGRGFDYIVNAICDPSD